MENYQKLTAACLLFLSFVTLAIVLSMAKIILIPFTMAMFISLMFSPAIGYLYNKLSLPTPIALGVTFIGFIISFALIIFLMNSSIESFMEDADKYTSQLQKASQDVSKASKEVGYQLTPWEIRKKIKDFPSPKFIESVMSQMATLVSNTFLVVVFALFFMAGETVSKRDIPIIEEIKKSVGTYMGTKLLTSTLTGIITYIILKSFGIEMAFMFAMLTFLLNFIPNFGSVVAVLLPVPIIFLQYSLGLELFLCVGLMLTIQMLIGNVLEPRIQGDSMGLHPVTVLFCLTFWGFIWGVPGMFLSVPITASIKIIFSKFRVTKSFAEILAGDLRSLRFN